MVKTKILIIIGYERRGGEELVTDSRVHHFNKLVCKEKKNGVVVGGAHGDKGKILFLKMEEIIVYLYVNWNDPKEGKMLSIRDR